MGKDLNIDLGVSWQMRGDDFLDRQEAIEGVLYYKENGMRRK